MLRNAILACLLPLAVLVTETENLGIRLLPAPGKVTVGGGLRVQGEGIDDTLFLSRAERHVDADDIHFTGRCAAILRRPAGVPLVLLEGTDLRCGDLRLSTPGEVSETPVGQPKTPCAPPEIS